MSYTIHTPETAPEAAKDVLTGAKKAFGFVPNLLAVMAEAPTLVNAYTTLDGLFAKTSLTPTERQTVLLTVSYENDCEYCVAAHSVIAGMQKVPADVIEALRNGVAHRDGKLEALRRFTSALVHTRGWLSKPEVEAFLAAGYGRQQVLEVMLGVGLKTLSNYTNHIAETPLDAAFGPAAWSKAA
jgi:uncharacterized peroxidase-related enzyme